MSRLPALWLAFFVAYGAGCSAGGSATADLAATVDAAPGLDLRAAPDQAPLADLSIVRDAAGPADLALPIDLSRPADLARSDDAGALTDPRCTAAGATPAMISCCKMANDYPNGCLLGACSCAPMNSHMVKSCLCPMGKCFDGMMCR